MPTPIATGPVPSPWRLDEGIYLEKVGILLSWLALPGILAELGDGQRDPGPGVTLRWRDAVAFGGLRLDIESFMADPVAAAGPESRLAPWYGADRFVCIHSTYVRLDETTTSDPFRHYRAVRAHLAAHLGPEEEEVSESTGYPGTVWIRPVFSLSWVVADRMGPYTSLVVSHASARHIADPAVLSR